MNLTSIPFKLLSQLLRPVSPRRLKVSSKKLFNGNFFSYVLGEVRMHMERKEREEETRILLGNKRNKLLIHAIAWVDLKGSMLSGKSRSQKVTYCESIYITLTK